MTNIMFIIITSLLNTDPYIAYLFFAMIAIGVGITYFYRKEVGFIMTATVSSFLGYSGMFYPFTYALSAVCLTLLILSLMGGGSILRPLNNLESWIYLKKISKKTK
jgi:hypothetical protein